ncbi:MAG: NAD-dependent epimerase/dehydratase [Chthonomonadaceae bacterium]|nr:NAD-dependent epimerase/dehydratase [Chthonomonadaceae bacterium]
MPQEESSRILITGANGFVGRHMIAALQSSGKAQIFAATHAIAENSLNVGDGSPVVQALLDIQDAAATQRLFASLRPTHVVHLAARASGADTDRDAVFAVNVEGTRHLLDAARSLAAPPRVLLVSTGYVYGSTEADRPARESDPLVSPGKFGAYTDSKIAMEAIAKEYANLAFVARAFSHTGPGQAPTFAIPAFARQLARIERGEQAPEIMVGNLEARRDLLDVRDVVDAYMLLLERGVPGETYNVANGAPVSMREILDRLRALCTTPTEVHVDPNRLRPADIACSSGDPLKLCTVTGWQPRYALDTTLLDTLAYWRTEDSEGQQ